MKKKITKKKTVSRPKQIIEIHIYVHQNNNLTGTNLPPYNPINPPYFVTC